MVGHGGMVRLGRSSMLEVMDSEYVKFARVLLVDILYAYVNPRIRYE